MNLIRRMRYTPWPGIRGLGVIHPTGAAQKRVRRSGQPDKYALLRGRDSNPARAALERLVVGRFTQRLSTAHSNLSPGTRDPARQPRADWKAWV
ncbi:hypothetical protein GORHZ_078_00240 [Gordonia rhizosphera NBRC 16068]|uniref:Uncharacterized protein n=1 Tax=Gordonia rhizosphera NBRC 16068 TaxID=1108045 RepID=K6V1Z1_9ACTN|nr:hypothetical protein GORHZ_078_00240 [Gordonia rhizosphera NBRC 16068]